MPQKTNKKKYLYAVISWGAEPIVFRTKISLVKYFKKNNSRLVDTWFKNTWFILIDNTIILKLQIPKIKSKIRK